MADERREPKNFLERHALESLRAEPGWTLRMYCALNDLSDETRRSLSAFLAPHLPPDQLR
jgi:hypothetical protein